MKSKQMSCQNVISQWIRLIEELGYVWFGLSTKSHQMWTLKFGLIIRQQKMSVSALKRKLVGFQYRKPMRTNSNTLKLFCQLCLLWRSCCLRLPLPVLFSLSEVECNERYGHEGQWPNAISVNKVRSLAAAQQKYTFVCGRTDKWRRDNLF